MEDEGVPYVSTWVFPGAGWWLSRLALLAGAAYLGYRLGRRAGD